MQEWYSGALIQHGADILDAVLPVVKASQPGGDTPCVRLAIQISPKLVCLLLSDPLKSEGSVRHRPQQARCSR